MRAWTKAGLVVVVTVVVTLVEQEARERER